MQIDDRIMLKLHEAGRERQATLEGDIADPGLCSEPEAADMLMAEIRRMQGDTYIGEVDPPKDVLKNIEKHRLDEDAWTKVSDYLQETLR